MRAWILAMMVLLAACKRAEEGAPTWSATPQAAEVEQVIRGGRLRYAQDPNTGMCFAYGWMHHCCGHAATGGPIVTWVPCDSLQVEAPK